MEEPGFLDQVRGRSGGRGYGLLTSFGNGGLTNHLLNMTFGRWGFFKELIGC